MLFYLVSSRKFNYNPAPQFSLTVAINNRNYCQNE
jgi:hypothetical protein